MLRNPASELITEALESEQLAELADDLHGGLFILAQEVSRSSIVLYVKV